MSVNYQEPNQNPYSQDYQIPYYMRKDSYYQSQNDQQASTDKINSNSNTNTQPLIDSCNSIDYTEPFLNINSNENNNQSANCDKYLCWKCFLLFELILDIIGLIIYLAH